VEPLARQPAAPTTDDELTRVVALARGSDPAQTMAVLGLGPGDPQTRLEPGAISRASWFSSGPATLRIELAPGRVIARAWGPGAAQALDAVPAMNSDPGLVLADDVRQRYDVLAATAGLTAGLEGNWAAFTGRALDAATLTGLLTRHDQETADATRQGSAAHYKAALALLDKSDATIAEARALAARLGTTSDTSTLTTWLDRNAAYDAAVRNLYQSMIDAKGRVTSKVRAALAAEKEARANLPGDTRGLVVIMAEVAQGGLNQAVISIEQVRGSLAAAIETQGTLRDPPPPPE